ncbi:MAG TPA: DUF1080 domain-containing protein [Bryobacterales bacterium]|nr:DUF1080 domain-containing protein [Bryobacterales bacterium]
MRLPLVFLFLASAVWAAPPGDEFLGRWDLTVTAGSRQYPSWLEVTRSGGSLNGRFVGGGGSVRPARVELSGGEIRFSPEHQGRNKVAATESYTGRLADGKLEGTGMSSQGRELRWTGVRAIRPATPERAPRWGKPVSLLTGNDLSGWTFKDPRGRECWSFSGGVLVNAPPCPDTYTLQRFRDFKLHVEYNLDAKSNSGVYLRGRYEVQIEDQGPRELESHGVGAIYGFLTPSVKAARKAGEWQTFDITLIGYRVTVVFNGKTTIDNQEIPGITGGAIDSDEAAPGPIMLQGDHGRVQFRNILLTPGT